MSIEVIVPRRGINDDGLGKKHALHKLISQATTDYVWLQDDDILPPTNTPPIQADLVILPLRMQGGPSLIERLQCAEYAAIQELTIWSAQHSHPVMCSGANLIVHRERWLESYVDLHPQLPSGDDMFLLESFKRRHLSIVALDDPSYTATVNALPSLRSLLRQRMRWAGKAPHYTDRDIIVCGIMVGAANVLQVLCPPILLIKFPIEYHMVKKRDPKVSFLIVLLLEIIYPFYMLICLIGGRIRRTW